MSLRFCHDNSEKGMMPEITGLILLIIYLFLRLGNYSYQNVHGQMMSCYPEKKM